MSVLMRAVEKLPDWVRDVQVKKNDERQRYIITTCILNCYLYLYYYTLNTNNKKEVMLDVLNFKIFIE